MRGINVRIVIELDVTELDVVIRVNREGQAAVVRSVGPAAISAGPAVAAPAELAEDGGTTDAGPAPERNDE
ncbi:hypothetical protein [Lentzea atacamensis]|uniref:hypothetical protein n=1 Tax=Lentzea atacamensis TaxID=531938 RepID=UPI0011BFB88A|nr:hypothetical protein [Lentzea atacamensis]